jgi:asparagine synthase (glutamine-hydrolysing)
MKQDSMSMATSIESRVPFLDHLLVEWAASLPASVKLRGRTGKALVREAAQAHLPNEVANGPKRGFLVPLARWLRGVGRSSLETHLPASDDELFSSAAARTLMSEHMAGMDHTGRLWRLLAFQVWRNDTLPRMARLAELGRGAALQTAGR